MNRIVYADNNPVSATDPSGHLVWFAAIAATSLAGSFIGAATAFTGYAGVALVTGSFDVRDAEIATATGALAGAVAPWLATETVGAILLGAGANGLQYWATQTARGETATPTGVAIAGALGAVGGRIGGTVPSGLEKAFMYQGGKAIMRSREAWSTLIRSNATRGVAGAITSNLPAVPALAWDGDHGGIK